MKLHYLQHVSFEGREALIKNYGNKLGDGPIIQTKEQMRNGGSNLEKINAEMEHLLNALLNH